MFLKKMKAQNKQNLSFPPHWAKHMALLSEKALMNLSQGHKEQIQEK